MGFNNFVEVFKVPIIFFAGYIPLLGVILAYNRMRQTDILNFKTSFNNLLNTFNNYRDSIADDLGVGREFIAGYYRAIEGRLLQASVDSIKDIIDSFHIGEKHIKYSVYINNLALILMSIRNNLSIIKNKSEYTNIVAFQLNNIEKRLILLYAITKNINDDIVGLIKEYKIIDDVDMNGAPNGETLRSMFFN